MFQAVHAGAGIFTADAGDSAVEKSRTKAGIKQAEHIRIVY